jgi:uncharacterized protein YbaR (Trm112 family)
MGEAEMCRSHPLHGYTSRPNMIQGADIESDCYAGDRSMTAAPERPEGTVDPKLLEILVCPMTKGPLEYDAARQELISRSAKLAYPIRDGIPIMLPEEARKID